MFSIPLFLNASGVLSEDSWVTEFGATNHITFCSSHFSFYQPSSGKHPKTVADATHTPVGGHGNFKILSSLALNNVLNVPMLSTNLISIHKITDDLNCAVEHWSFISSLDFIRIPTTVLEM